MKMLPVAFPYEILAPRRQPCPIWGRDTRASNTRNASLNSRRLSYSVETRQTRQIGLKLLNRMSDSLSGRPKNPTYNPTNPNRKPDKFSEHRCRMQERSELPR